MDHNMDPHGMDPHEIDPHGVDPGLGHPDPADHGWAGDTDPADHGWAGDADPADHGWAGDADPAAGHHDLTPDEPGPGDLGHDHLDHHLTSAATADLGFAEEYGHPHLGAGHPLDDVAGGTEPGGHTPIGYGDLSADLPDHLHDMAGLEDAPFGADPDLYPLTDGLGHDAFPPPLDVDAPEPIDGYPWTDPSTLGHDPLPALDDPAGHASGGPDLADLYEYSGEQPPQSGDAWTALIASDDPATSALARWWSAG